MPASEGDRRTGGAGRRRRPDGATAPLVPTPDPTGRSYRGRRRVRLADVRPSGKARLDAVARWLQDVATDDVREAGARDAYAWVVRRTVLQVVARPRYEEPVELVTWCSGAGAAWAERRTTVTGEAGVLVEGVSVWVSLDPATLRPCPLGPDFTAIYGPAGGGRTVRSRLLHEAAPPEGAARRAWPLRDADFDVLGHVNNAVAWMAVEEEARRRGRPLRTGWAEVEYRAALEGVDLLEVASTVDERGVRVWLLGPSGEAAVTALLRPAGGAGAGPVG